MNQMKAGRFRPLTNRQCGWLCFRPSWMQRWGTPSCLLVFLCAYFLVNSVVINGIFSSSISTIEKRFSLSSSQMGMVTSIYDISALIFVGPVSYFGTRRRSRWIGFGMLTMGLGYLVFLLPHLIIEKYHPVIGLASPIAGNTSSSSSLLCKSSPVSSANCASSSNESGLYYAIFLLGMCLAGAGCTPMLAIGVPYLDDSVHPKKSPMFISTFLTSGILAVVIGFAMNYFFLRVFVNPDVFVTLIPKDGQWIGAWWLGFAVGFVLALIVGIALLAFPGELENAKKVREQLERETLREEKREDDVPSLKLEEMPRILKELLIDNPTYVFVVIFSSLEFFGISSLIAFLPKMIAAQFRISPSKVSLTFGMTVISASAIGNISGARIQQRFNLGCLGALKLSTITSFIAMLFFSFLFIYCDSSAVAGVNTAYLNSSENLLNLCNLNCSCTMSSFLPVCAHGLTYANPCYAGCTKRYGEKIFSNCSCLARDSIAKLGTCPVSCGVLPYVYYILMFLSFFFWSLSGVPVYCGMLRCVPFRLKTFAVGIGSLLMRVLGSIPGPIFVGYLIDKSCLFWDRTCDNKRGSCHLYDHKQMALSVAVTLIIFKAIGTLSIFIAWQIYKRKSVMESDSIALEQLNSTDIKDKNEN